MGLTWKRLSLLADANRALGRLEGFLPLGSGSVREDLAVLGRALDQMAEAVLLDAWSEVCLLPPGISMRDLQEAISDEVAQRGVDAVEEADPVDRVGAEPAPAPEATGTKETDNARRAVQKWPHGKVCPDCAEWVAVKRAKAKNAPGQVDPVDTGRSDGKLQRLV